MRVSTFAWRTLSAMAKVAKVHGWYYRPINFE